MIGPATRLLMAGISVSVAMTSILTAQIQVLPPPEGSRGVGYWRTTLESAAPVERSNGGRTLLLEVWYPAGRSPPPVAKRYATPAIEDALTRQFGFPAGWIAQHSTHAGEGAPVLDGRHPIVIFSHGLSWPVTLYQAIIEDLASQGYVVVGINHPGGTVIDYGGGRVAVPEDLPSFPNDSAADAHLARMVAMWTDDARAVLNLLPRWNAGALPGPLAGHLDLDRLALLGHSLGGSALARLSGDRRVRAVVALEGKFRDTTAAPLTMQAPFLHLIGEYNRLELENREYRPSNGAPVFQAVIAGTGHAYFSDVIMLYKPHAPSDWLARHRYELEPQRIIQIARDYITAFLGRYLLGTDHSLLHPTSYAARVAGPRSAGYAEVRLTIDVP